MVAARVVHRRSKRGNRPVGVEQVGAGNRSASSVAAGDQNAAVLQQSGGGARSRGRQVSCRLPRAARNRQNETLECHEGTKQESYQEYSFSRFPHRQPRWISERVRTQQRHTRAARRNLLKLYS